MSDQVLTLSDLEVIRAPRSVTRGVSVAVPPVVVEGTRSSSARAIVPWLIATDSASAAVSVAAAAAALSVVSGGAALTPLVLVLMVLSVPLWTASLVVSRAYETRYLYAGSGEMHRVGIAAGMTGLAVLLGSWLLIDPHYAPVVVLAGVLTLLLTLLVRWLVRMHAQRLNRAGVVRARVVTVGERSDVDRLATRLGRNTYHGWAVVDEVVTAPPAHDLTTHLATDPSTASATDVDISAIVGAARSGRADVVLLTPSAGAHLGSITELQRELMTSGIELALAPPMVEAVGPRVTVEALCGLPVLRVRPPELSGPRRWIKVAGDRVAAATGLLLLLPLLTTLWLAVRLTSRGPALFRQERVGRGGVPFTMLKFRSMYLDAEARRRDLEQANEGAGPLFKMARDPRVTPVGRFLRKTSLDELPQLWNVLTGDMSLVGPRPALPHEVRQYDRDTTRRLLVAPGITGLWQVHGRSDLDWAESKRLDLRYVENWSLGFDMSILMRTVDVVLRGRGAY